MKRSLNGASRGGRWLLITLLLAGCDKTPAAIQNLVGNTSDADDPCRFLTAAELQPYVGDLVAPPYRYDKDEGKPDASSDGCLYRGRNGQSVVVTYSPRGASGVGTLTRRIPNVADRLLANGSSGTGGMAKRIMQPVQGPWDNATWFPTGSLMVYKGDQALIIDVTASAAGQDGAVALAKLAVERLGHPLDYNGASAVAQAPKPHARLANACDLVPKAKVEAALGALTAPPVPDSAGTTCTYHVHGADGDESYAMAVGWANGYAQLNTLKRSTNMVGGLISGSAGGQGAGKMPAIPAIPKMDSTTQQMFVKGFTAILGKQAAAPIKNGMRTDTALVGPWDSAALINGLWVIAVRHDVSVLIQLTDGDFERAKALIAAACEQL